ncbi:hypothetical protein [Rhizobium phaseoli]|uniref:hypothetical protein n=1 Tax=Rhizobium phaseoli TaxID=396 RepID=UPI0007EAF0B6|nr:hypothetical protein [Rhizobium phaseoli]
MKRWIKPCAQAGPSYSQLASAPHRTNTSATLHFATSSCAYAVPMFAHGLRHVLGVVVHLDLCAEQLLQIEL